MAKVSIELHGVGTKKTGFAKAEYGPFRCGHCVWFDWGKGDKKPSHCEHPEVKADPDVEKTSGGDAKVSAEDCCNLFRPTRKLVDIPLSEVGL